MSSEDSGIRIQKSGTLFDGVRSEARGGLKPALHRIIQHSTPLLLLFLLLVDLFAMR
jgi:hypothetical protein